MDGASTMQRIGRWVLLAVATGLVVQTARPHYHYGAWLDATATIELAGLLIPFGMGVTMVLLHVAKAMMLAVAAWFWRCAHYAYSVLAVLLFLLLLPVSISSMFGFLDLQRGTRAASEASLLKHEADLRAELTSVQAWLKDIGWRRAAAAVEAEIAAERRNPFWASTSDCRDAGTRPQQRYCQTLDRLAGELPGAKEADEYRRREKTIHAELQSAKPATGSLHPDLEFLSRALGVSVEQARFWRTIMFAVVIEATEALLLLFGSAPAPARQERQDRTQRLQIVSRLFLTYRRAHAWVARKIRRHAADAVVPSQAGRSMPTLDPQDITCTAAENGQAMGTKSASSRETTSPNSRRAYGGDLSPGLAATTRGIEPAVVAFVAELPRVPEARVRGSEMFTAYDLRRRTRGWPRLSRTQFGRQLKPAIEAVGGRKVKSNCQVYLGVSLSPA
jgi:hypothetical protein